MKFPPVSVFSIRFLLQALMLNLKVIDHHFCFEALAGLGSSMITVLYQGLGDALINEHGASFL